MRTSVDFFINNISTFFYIWLIPAALSLIFNYFYPISEDFFSDLSLEDAIITLGFSLVGGLLSMLSYIGYVYVAIKPEEKNLSVILSYAIDNAFKFILTLILVSIVVILGFFFFIIPGIIFAFWFMFVPFVVLVENLQGTQALSQSKKYVKGKLLTIIGKSIFIGLFSILYYVVLAIPALFLLSISEYASLAAFSVISFPLTCVNVIFCYQLYLDLRSDFEKSVEGVPSMSVPPPQSVGV